VPGVTLLGDAAHPDDVEAAVALYEQAMFVRSAQAARNGAKFYENMSSENRAQNLISVLAGHQQTP
jgi:hypothetical protein